LHSNDSIEDFYALIPDANVYSYFLYMVPIEERRAGWRMTWALAFSVAILVVNFVMQFCLLFVVGNFVLEHNKDKVHSIIFQRPHEWYDPIIPESWKFQEKVHCRTSESLCYPEGDRVSCSPPSIYVLNRWDLLDTNGDGLWSRDEASNVTYRDFVQCKYNVDIMTLYNVMIGNLRTKGGLDGRRHPNITRGTSMHKAYFDWYMGEPLLCQYGDADMCGTLFLRGFFNDAMSSDSAESARGIKDYNTAREYCLNLLANKCDLLLPGTFRVWRLSRAEKCGAKLFSPASYDLPGSVARSLQRQWVVTLDFQQRVEYGKGRNVFFMLYLSILMVTFVLTMIEEFHGIYTTFLWVIQHPHIGGEKGDTAHRCAVVAINVLRTILWCYLLYSGMVFLTHDTGYLNLIFDALSLVFIIQIDELLYRTILTPKMTEEHLALQETALRRKRLPISRVGVTFLIAMSTFVFTTVISTMHCKHTMQPIENALRCICSMEGDHCIGATTNDKKWWTDYWTKTLPNSIEEISRIMKTA